MIADIDWKNLQVATAFVLGAVLGSIATIRVMRAILHTFDWRGRVRRNDQGKEDNGS
jgi:uncharacterized membrane protein